MTLYLGATATPDWGALPWDWITLFLAVASVIYALACWWMPFGHCRRCKGKGRFSSKSGRHFRDCRRCKGSGRRLRLGRKVANKLRAIHHAGS